MKKVTTTVVTLNDEDIQKAVVNYVNSQRIADTDVIFSVDHIIELDANADEIRVRFQETET